MYSEEEIAQRAVRLEEHLLDFGRHDESYRQAYSTLKDTLLKAKKREIKDPIIKFPFGRLFSEHEGWLKSPFSRDLYMDFKISVDTLTQLEREARVNKRMEMYERRKKSKEKENKA